MLNISESEKIFVERLKEFRVFMNIKQGEMSKILGVGESYYSRLENHQTKPIAEIFWAIHEKWNLSIGKLLDVETPVEKLLSNDVKYKISDEQNNNSDIVEIIQKNKELVDKVAFYEKIIMKMSTRK